MLTCHVELEYISATKHETGCQSARNGHRSVALREQLSAKTLSFRHVVLDLKDTRARRINLSASSVRQSAHYEAHCKFSQAKPNTAAQLNSSLGEHIFSASNRLDEEMRTLVTLASPMPCMIMRNLCV